VAAGDFLDAEMPNANDLKRSGGKYFHEYYVGMGHPITAHRWAWHAYADGERVWAAYHNRNPGEW
jgi:hypothetical protein